VFFLPENCKYLKVPENRMDIIKIVKKVKIIENMNEKR